jgi:hypothetical protein
VADLPDEQKLNPEIKQKWCSALRSGKYEQGQGLLHDPNDNTYCCLGVLRELTGLPKAGEDLEYLDYEKANEIGLSSDSQCELADQNDDGHSFEEIAAYIEGTL